MAGLISPATVEQIRSASDIVDVIGGYLPLKRAGANFVTHCPFHKEKSPSFNVNPHRQIFHCFGCHKGGDVFTFVQEYESLSFVEAIRRLADRANIPLEFDQRPGQPQARHLKETLLEIHEQITQRWQAALAKEAGGQIARDYLAKRSVPAEAVTLFRLGYAPEAWDDTVNWAKSKGHALAEVEKAGLILRKEGSDKFYDRFRGRLIFPICDEQSRVIGFSGRILSGDEKTAKYVNSPETPVFTKGKVFFGLDKSKRALLDADIAVVCEGQLDLIACFMAGVQNVVAPQGTAFTGEHARILKRYVKKIVLCFDSDLAGQNAAVRSLDTLLASGPELLVRKRDKNPAAIGRLTQKIIGDALPSGLAIGVATIPAPHDPDSFIKEFGVAAFQRLIDGAQDFFDYFLNRLCGINDAESDLGRRTILQAMSEAVNKTGDAVLIDKYAQKTALRLGVSSQSVLIEFKKASRSKSPVTDSPEGIPESPVEAQRPSLQEFWLLRLLLQDETHLAWAAGQLKLEWIQHPVLRKIIERRLHAQANGEWRGVATLLSDMEDAAKSLITEAAADPDPIKNAEEILKGSVLKKGLIATLREKFIDQQLAALTQRVVASDVSDAERLVLLRRQQELRQLKRQPLS